MSKHEAMLERDNLLWTSEGRKRIISLMDGARIAAIHECADKAAELDDCSGRFIADQLRDMAIARDGAIPDGYCPKCEVYAPYPGGDAKHDCGTPMSATP